MNDNVIRIRRRGRSRVNGEGQSADMQDEPSATHSTGQGNGHAQDDNQSTERETINAIADEQINRLNRQYAVVVAGSKVVIMRESLDPLTGNPDIALMQVKDFKTLLENQDVEVPAGNNTKTIKLADFWLRHARRREYDGLVFNPREPQPEDTLVEGEDNGPESRCFNLWRGFGVEPAEGDCRLYLDHVRNVVCGGDENLSDYVLAWLADAVQNPAERPGVALVLRGEQGTGKGTFAKHFGALFGNHYIQVSNPGQLTGRYNSHLKDKLIVFADEAFWAGDKAAEGQLKRMITEETLVIEPKFVDAFKIKNHTRLIVSSNHDWIVPAGAKERRFVVLDLSAEHLQDYTYFQAIEVQMDNGGREALLHYLQNYNLQDINLRQIPRTEALLDQQRHSMRPVEAWWYDRLMAGCIMEGRNDWASEPVQCKFVQDDYRDHSKNIGALRKATETELGVALKKFAPGLRREKRTSCEVRQSYYIFPSLEECRTDFDCYLGNTTRWPTGPNPEAEPETDPDGLIDF